MQRVLIVDDERSIRITLSAFLQAEGYEVASSSMANEALDLLRETPFDVVVSDIILPQLSGVQLLQAISREAPEAKVLLMTGEPSVDTATEAVRFGACEYLVKPVSKDAIIRAVGHAVALKQVEDQRRELDAEKARYREELEARVSSRTAELEASNERLHSALETIRRTQENLIRHERLNALGQMVSGIVHDFNNSLMPILGYSDLLLDDMGEVKEDDPDSKYFVALTAIRDAANDARDIVRRLREFYRPHEGLDVADVDLAELVRNVVRVTETVWRIETEAEGREVYLDMDVDSLGMVPCNEPRIRECLTNLIINAVDAMPEGGRITISGTCAQNNAHLTIRDTGSGMPPDVMRRCIEPFFTTKGEAGTGLGLAMCYGILQQHGGRLDIKSELGKGTAITLVIPLVRRDVSGKPITSLDQPIDVGSLRILAVDDEDQPRLLVGRYLKRDGHQVQTFAAGSDLLDVLQKEGADLVVTDRAMPGMGGDEIARLAKEICPDIAVLLLTGFGDMMKLKNERPDGVDFICGKPITRKELSQAVRDTLAAVEQNKG